ncbi:Bystin [Rhynchospora pubera]|uniref:Bystin n=1 Tax=Rhynchospora pubera TaxID=906938 RepID=A0AAV8E5N2_9POAL|nr:Bystin [Rhynchospora pubera]
MAGKKRKEMSSQKPPRQKHSLGLDSDLDSVVSSKKRARAPKNHQSENKTISSDLSSKIIKEALKQQKEILEEENREDKVKVSFSDVSALSSALDEDGEGEGEGEDEIDAFDGFSDTLSQYDGGELEIDEEDEKVLAAFMKKETGQQLTLADIIIQRIKEKDAQVAADAQPRPKLTNATIDHYKQVGEFLSRYTSGKIPKPFKSLPSLQFWEELLYLTEPQNWSANAMYQATRIFSSNLRGNRVVIFYKNVLLPRVRDDIRKNRRLHFSLYQSLKKSLYKPGAFFKGILFPLCESGTCSLREAVIIGSIVQKVSIPHLHSSAALMKLAQMDYCGTTSYFIKLFLDKKYALPYRVLDAVLEHFLSFLEKETIMPVIWHQSLLSFVQRYKNELQRKDKDNLERLMQHQKHYLVTPEIKRELKNSHNRGERVDDATSISSMSVLNKPIEEDRWDVPEVPMEED